MSAVTVDQTTPLRHGWRHADKKVICQECFHEGAGVTVWKADAPVTMGYCYACVSANPVVWEDVRLQTVVLEPQPISPLTKHGRECATCRAAAASGHITLGNLCPVGYQLAVEKLDMVTP